LDSRILNDKPIIQTKQGLNSFKFADLIQTILDFRLSYGVHEVTGYPSSYCIDPYFQRIKSSFNIMRHDNHFFNLFPLKIFWFISQVFFVEAKLSRLFWWCQRLLKIHSNKIKESRRFKNLKKSIKVSIKIIFQRKYWITQFVQKNFLKKNLLPEFLLSGNRLPEAQNSFITVLQSSNRLPQKCDRLPMFLNVETKYFQNNVIDYIIFVIDYEWFLNVEFQTSTWRVITTFNCVINYTIMVIDYHWFWKIAKSHNF